MMEKKMDDIDELGEERTGGGCTKRCSLDSLK